jgi:hypothetical protein
MRVILSNIFLIVCVLGFFVGVRFPVANIVLRESVIISILCLLFFSDWIASIVADRMLFFISYLRSVRIYLDVFSIVFVKRFGRFRSITLAAGSWSKRAEPDVKLYFINWIDEYLCLGAGGTKCISKNLGSVSLTFLV